MMSNGRGGHREGLPDGYLAVVDAQKITSYLLSGNHPAGRAKATFFRRFGFRLRSWRRLRDALVDHAHAAEIITVTETEFGRKFIVEGPLASPDGRNPTIRSVWFVAIGDRAPRLVTAYPVPESGR
jgi:hypothetical protein